MAGVMAREQDRRREFYPAAGWAFFGPTWTGRINRRYNREGNGGLP
jgi:hypothetical protein